MNKYPYLLIIIQFIEKSKTQSGFALFVSLLIRIAHRHRLQ